jgi:hypothetical protein
MPLPQIVSAGRVSLIPHLPEEVVEFTGHLDLLHGQFEAAPSPPSRRLKVQVPSQGTMSNWCWAAVAVGIAEAYGDSAHFSMCAIASKVQSVTCCSQPVHPDCDRQQPLSLALVLGEGHCEDFFPRAKTQTLVSDPEGCWTFITGQIDRHRPIAVRMQLGPDERYGHFVVITGYDRHLLGRQLFVGDPRAGESQFALSEFISRYLEDGRWHSTYITKGNHDVPEM